MPVRWGPGYGLFGGAFGWGGWGGSLVVIDPEGRMAMAYMTDQMRDPADDTRETTPGRRHPGDRAGDSRLRRTQRATGLTG